MEINPWWAFSRFSSRREYYWSLLFEGHSLSDLNFYWNIWLSLGEQAFYQTNWAHPKVNSNHLGYPNFWSELKFYYFWGREVWWWDSKVDCWVIRPRGGRSGYVGASSAASQGWKHHPFLRLSSFLIKTLLIATVLLLVLRSRQICEQRIVSYQLSQSLRFVS